MWLVPLDGGSPRRLRQANGQLAKPAFYENRRAITLNYDGTEAVFAGGEDVVVKYPNGASAGYPFQHQTTIQYFGRDGTSSIVPMDMSVFGPLFTLIEVEASSDMSVVLACAAIPRSTPVSTGLPNTTTTIVSLTPLDVLLGSMYAADQRCAVYRRN